MMFCLSAVKLSALRQIIHSQRCNYATMVSASAISGKAKKKLGKMGAVLEKKVLPVETDAEKLVKFVCGSNINNEGTDIELKPDSEYPEWLWTLNTGKPKPLEELDPNTKEYWKKVKKRWIIHHNKLTKLKKF